MTPNSQRRRSIGSKSLSKADESLIDRGVEGSAGDSSSDVSDEGFRSAGNTRKPDETEERPDSSCTQVSQGSSGAESSGSAEDESGRKKNSKIPLLENLRAPSRTSGRKSAEPTPSAPLRFTRSSSVTSSEGSNTSSDFQRRDGFGRHSLRGRPSDATRKPTPTTPTTPRTKHTSTWSCQNRRERPSLSRDTFSNPAGSGVKLHLAGSRSTSASPHSRRRVFGTPVNGRQSPEARRPSKLVAELLNDVELDNDASILKKMEQIVNQYKARVEGILAAEGKTLNDEWDTPPPLSSPSGRRNSLGSGLTSQIPIRRLRKDGLHTPTPSKIPMPLFYQRSKEACH